MRRHLPKLIPCGIAVFVAGCFFAVYTELSKSETAENLASVNWLPQAATNVSFYKSYAITAYEFDIPESEFHSWVRWEVQEIAEPVEIMRYTRVTQPLPTFGDALIDDEFAMLESKMEEHRTRIDNGLYYGHLRDNGGGVWVGYDRDEGRAYFHSQPR